jgi:hypothetical protein
MDTLVASTLAALELDPSRLRGRRSRVEQRAADAIERLSCRLCQSWPDSAGIEFGAWCSFITVLVALVPTTVGIKVFSFLRGG